MFTTALASLLAASDKPVVLDKMTSTWVDEFSRSLIKSGLILSPQSGNVYHIITSVSETKLPYLTFTMGKYGVSVARAQQTCVALGGLAPQMAYRNRAVIKRFFQALTHTLDTQQMPCVLDEVLTDVSSKYNQTYLQSINFHARDLMTLAGVESNSKWVRLPSEVKPGVVGLRTKASNAPLYYTEGDLPGEPEFDRSAHENVGIGTRAILDLQGGLSPIRGCIICGIHHYTAKVGYDLYVPDGGTDDGGKTYTLLSNLDSISVIPLIKYTGEERKSVKELNEMVSQKYEIQSPRATLGLDLTSTETFQFANKVWDIGKGLGLVSLWGIKPEKFSVEDLSSFLKFTRVDKEHAGKTNNKSPLLIATHLGGLLLIDGYHRLTQAIERGDKYLYGCVLDSEQTKSIEIK